MNDIHSKYFRIEYFSTCSNRNERYQSADKRNNKQGSEKIKIAVSNILPEFPPESYLRRRWRSGGKKTGNRIVNRGRGEEKGRNTEGDEPGSNIETRQRSANIEPRIVRKKWREGKKKRKKKKRRKRKKHDNEREDVSFKRRIPMKQEESEGSGRDKKRRGTKESAIDRGRGRERSL